VAHLGHFQGHFLYVLRHRIVGVDAIFGRVIAFCTSFTRKKVQDEQYDPNGLNPTGRLDGGLTINALASKSFDNAYGKFTWGFKYYHKSGQPFSISRYVYLKNQYPGVTGNTNIGGTTQFNQYLDGVGTHNFESQTKVALSGQQDFNPVKVGGYKVVGFLKLAVDNLFNHQQQVNWNTTTVKSSTTTSEAWAYGNSFGTPTGFANYVPARTVALSAGIKF